MRWGAEAKSHEKEDGGSSYSVSVSSPADVLDGGRGAVEGL